MTPPARCGRCASAPATIATVVLKVRLLANGQSEVVAARGVLLCADCDARGAADGPWEDIDVGGLDDAARIGRAFTQADGPTKLATAALLAGASRGTA